MFGNRLKSAVFHSKIWQGARQAKSPPNGGLSYCFYLDLGWLRGLATNFVDFLQLRI
jgi:hypothetical protein